MPNTTATAPGALPRSKSLPARFVGVITAPRETFESVVAHPKWFGMMVLVTIIAAVFTALPMTTEAGREATLRSQVEGMESFGMTVTDEAYEGMRRNVQFAPYTTAGAVLIVSPIITLVIAGILFAVFNIAVGGEATFKQVLSVLVHAGAITALQQLFTGPVNYFRGAVTSATNLAVLLPGVEPKSFLGWALAMTDLFIIWYLLVLAMGLGVLYRRRTQPIAMSLYAIYAAIVLVVSGVMRQLGGS